MKPLRSRVFIAVPQIHSQFNCPHKDGGAKPNYFYSERCAWRSLQDLLKFRQTPSNSERNTYVSVSRSRAEYGNEKTLRVLCALRGEYRRGEYYRILTDYIFTPPTVGKIPFWRIRRAVIGTNNSTKHHSMAPPPL